MTKRSLDMENKENEPQANSATTNDPLPAKKPKLITQIDDHEEENEVETDSDEEEDEDDVVEEEDEDEGPISISQVIEHNDGMMHPKYKEYFTYEGTDLSMVSRTARFWSRKYLQASRHVNPDAYGMYIHNDFVCYGELEVVENCLVDLAKGTLLKHKGQMNITNCITAFRRLEALTIVLQEADNFPGMDDGDRFVAILRVIGACYVSILTTLLPKSVFQNDSIDNQDDIKKLTKLAQQLPNFKEVLQHALIRAHLYSQIGDVSTAYINVLYTIYCHWSTIIDKKRIDLNVKPDEQDEEIWEALKCAARIKKTAYKESFNFLKELEIYSKTYPDLGGHSHDLRKWSKTRRNMYSFDNMDDEPMGNFWLRL